MGFGEVDCGGGGCAVLLKSVNTSGDTIWTEEICSSELADGETQSKNERTPEDGQRMGTERGRRVGWSAGADSVAFNSSAEMQERGEADASERE